MMFKNTNEGTIGITPEFATVQLEQEFLDEQLKLWRQVRNGDKTWKDMNEFRMRYGFPSVNVDSLRRSFGSMGEYDDNGWISSPDEGSDYPSKIVGQPVEKETITTNYDKGTTTSERIINLDEESVRDTDSLLKAHGFDPSAWTIKQAYNSKIKKVGINGDTYSYNSRITVTPRKITESDLINDVHKYFETFIPKYTPTKSMNRGYSDEVLVVPMYDMHWGRIKATYDDEPEVYNVDEEKDRILRHMDKYIQKFRNRRFETIYLIVGQDFFNSSFTGFTSSQSHLQDNALNFQNMYRSGCELLIEIILMFAELGNKVKVIGSLGNHATAEEFTMFMLLSAYFRECRNIEVDSSGAPRKYIKYGNSCIGFGHLDKEKDRIFGLMQIEAKHLWADTKTHVFIAGHLHHFSVETKQGVELYRAPAICYHDRWTVENGYTQNDPKTMCFIFDKDEGLAETHFMYL